jgi:hypothetical protein
MPLLRGRSDKVISHNIVELHKANKNKPKGEKRSHDQIIAIALSEARKGKS